MQPNSPYQPAAPTPQPHDYEFIVNPNQPQRRRPNLLPSGAPLALRIAIVAGVLLALMILFVIVRGLFSGGGNTESLVNVAQQQQQIIHLATDANKQSGLSTPNRDFSVTAQATLTSAQAQLITYLKKNGHKVDAKQLNLKISSNLDKQLETAAASSTYNSTYKQTMQTELEEYQQALQDAHKQTTGPKGRKLLSDQFNGAGLLLQQLLDPSS